MQAKLMTMNRPRPSTTCPVTMLSRTNETKIIGHVIATVSIIRRLSSLIMFKDICVISNGWRRYGDPLS